MKEPSMFWGFIEPLLVGLILGIISLPYEVPAAVAIILVGSALNASLVHLLEN